MRTKPIDICISISIAETFPESSKTIAFDYIALAMLAKSILLQLIDDLVGPVTISLISRH